MGAIPNPSRPETLWPSPGVSPLSGRRSGLHDCGMGRLLRQIGVATLMTAVVVVPMVVFSPQTVRPEPDFIAPR